MQLAAIQTELGKATLALDDLACAPDGRQLQQQIATVDLGALVRDSVRGWQPAAARAGVELTFDCAGAIPPVAGDRLRLAQATANLIANAIEHGGERVQLLCRPVGDGARVEVVDDGAGLPAPLDELVSRARRGRGRRGRGLAIVTSIATVHGGRLTAAPTDRGAHLVLDLPGTGK